MRLNTVPETELSKAAPGQTLIVLAIISLGLLILTRLISDVSFRLAYPLYQAWRFLDPDDSFLTITLHHIWQALFALAAILLIVRVYKVPLAEFGFNTQHWRFAVRRVLQFCAVWFIMQGSIGYWIMQSTDASAAFSFPMTARNFGGYFAFQLLLSGTSEEILFRALVMTPLLVYGRQSGLRDRSGAIFATAVATLIFMLAHINIAFDPLRVTHFNVLQQLTCLVFGLFYAHLFLRTRSIIGPMLAHNLLNVVIITTGLILFLMFG